MRLLAAISGISLAAILFIASPTATYATSQQATNPAQKVEVKSGDTLSGIAKEHQTTYVRLFNANNNIKNPDLIFPGDTIRIPSPDEKLADRGIVASTSMRPQPAKTSVPTPKQPARERKAPVVSHAASVPSGSVWDRLAQCESTGNWSINSGNGFYGGLQFTLSSWRAVGGSGYPHQASREEQILRAKKLQAIQGWGAWPVCSSKLGLR